MNGVVEVPEMKRILSGNPQLDDILCGGFPAHSINIIMGPPGTGKTILAQQTVFENARGDRPVVYMSTLSEPLSKVVGYLQHFGFYDESLMMDSVLYEDLGPGLLEHGVEHLLDRVRETIKEHSPALLVIDSFKAVHDLARSPLDVRRLASELGGLLAAYDVTTFLVGEYGPEAVADYPEFAVADGIVQLDRVSADKRDERHLRILKLRGTPYLEGAHAFVITGDGLQVYPRLVTPVAPEDYSIITERAATGVAGLDELMGGGLWRGSSALVLGPAGAGKTTFGLSFALHGAANGEPSLFVNFQENPTQLARTIQSLGIDVDRYEGKSLFLQYESPVEMAIDGVVVDVFRTIEEQGIKRVVIDSLADLALAADSRERFHDYLYSIVQHFASQQITSVLTLEGHIELEPRSDRMRARFSTLSDVMIALDVNLRSDPPVRTLRIVKARGIDHALDARPMFIEAGGLRVVGDRR